MKLLFGTTNKGKLAELRAMVATLPIDIVGLGDLGPLPEVVEDGATFEANACKKAHAYAKGTGLATLADDSGLCVDALEGAPGVLSARYGPGDDKARYLKLLSELASVAPENRGAEFRCALCLALPDGTQWVETGNCRGVIATEPSGQGGFGYDPVFWVPRFGKSMAELSKEEKASLSHRGEAFRAMRPHLAALAKSVTDA